MGRTRHAEVYVACPRCSFDGRLLRSFFGDALRYAWFESAKTPLGKAHEVRHWRVFCDQAWQPILPRGEVYSRELTERGWKSASELGVVIESPLTP